MIPSEFVEYVQGRVEFYQEEEERHQMRNALLASVIANFAPKSKRGRVYKPKDFMPKKKQTQEEMLREVERLNRMFGGRDLRRKE